MDQSLEDVDSKNADWSKPSGETFTENIYSEDDEECIMSDATSNSEDLENSEDFKDIIQN